MKLKMIRPVVVLGSGLLAMTMMLTFTPTAWADDVTSKFVPGTTISGVSIAGLSVEGAKEKIEQTLGADYQLTIKKKDGSTEKIKGSDFGFQVTVPEGLQAILDQQNANGRVSGPSYDNSNTLTLNTTYDENRLNERIMALDCISGGDIVPTQNARISPYQEGQPFTILPQVEGDSLDVEKTKTAMKQAVDAGAISVNLNELGCYIPVTVTKDDANLQQLVGLMNNTKDMTITYRFGEQSEPLSGEVICTWLTGVSDGQIQVNRDAAVAYLTGLAQTYNTAGQARIFRTTSGQELSLTGPYGWQMNVQAEADALIAMIRTGQSQEREPEYSTKAASRGETDWGSTYVEIDMANQHVYLYKDGAVVWDAPCVTGNVSKNYTTPNGIYGLYYKQTDRVLRGAKQADGSYEYESPVDYWMPFNGGIGLHDANWRSKFGGTIYQYSGSHGCINLPPSKTKALYDQLYAGIPVICHGS